MAIELSEQEQLRRQSLTALRNLGIEPYPAARYEVTATAREIADNYDDAKKNFQDVRIAGRIMSRRIMGSASFFELQDHTGRIQVYIRRDDVCPEGDPTLYNTVFKKLLDIGDFIGVEGFVFHTNTGELSVHCRKFTVLSKSIRPLPVVKEKDGKTFDAFTDPEVRYRQRYLDLIVNPQVKETFVRRARIMATMREFFNERGYIEVETPILQPIPGGASARPFITHHNSLDIDLYLRIATELYLKKLIVGGFDGVYEFGKNFRNEGMDRTHNPEFTCMEIYVAYKDYLWMMEFTEQMLERVAMAVNGTTELTLDGHPSLCQIAIQITWASDEPGRFSSLFGRVLDIGERCRRLEDYRQAFAAPVLHPALLPVTVGADHVLRITGKQVIGVLESCRSMFDTVRLVDPEICMQLTDTSDGAVVEKSEHCYAIWNKTQRCEHCISQEVIRTRRAQTKVEAVGDKVFYVHAVCVEVDGVPYALELVSPIRMEDLRGDEDASVLNQLLLRNRQVYIDSATHVYNRRYFDDHLRDLDGEFTLAMLDLDHFKHINDTYGHLAGDAALSRAAQAIRSAIRTGDELARYGGDEFLLLFHDMPRNALKKKLESIRAAVESLEFPEYPGLRITVSIGGAHAVGPLADTVQKADQALYHAKAAKNRTVLYKEDLQ